MTATELIKHNEVRKYLLETFPKPTVDHKGIFPEISSSGNKNPSLTGNAYEIFLCLLSAKKKLDIKNYFESKRKNALWNIKQTLNFTDKKNFKGHIRIYLNKADYEIKIAQIKRILNKKFILFEEVSKKFRYVVMENIKDSLTSGKITNKTGLIIAGATLEMIFDTLLQPIWGGAPQYTIIIDKDSLTNFIEGTIKKFEIQSSAFIQKRKLDKNFVELILEFTQISSQFYRSIDVAKGLHFEESYVNYVFELFNNVYERKDLHEKELIYKPSLKCLGILATPDFLVGDKILEIKTSKEFFSTDDYLQALIYIILSQHSQNKKRWGAIKEIEIFYPVYNLSVKIKLKENNDKIKPALKFLKEYSTNEPKTRLKQLKAQMFKEQKKKK